MTDAQFAEAVASCGDMIFRVAYSYLKNRADAEDVMQETLLKLYQSRESFQSEEHRRRWLIRVAANQARSLLRAVRRRQTVPLEEWADAPVFDNPEEGLLFEAVMALPRNYRLAVYLYYYEGYQAREIAALLRRSPSTVQTWLMRARQRLYTAMKEES